MQQGPFTCICGREFQNIQAFRGHKSHCEEHLKSTGRLHIRQQVDKENKQRISQGLKKKQAEIDAAKQQQWIDEQHHCERCGKLMLTKYGSGRFCSNFCAHAKPQFEEMKAKVSKTSKQAYIDGKFPQLGKNIVHNGTKMNARTVAAQQRYADNPKRCLVCNNIIPYERREAKTCSQICRLKLQGSLVKAAVARAGGNLNPYGRSGNAKYGMYHGIHCDSSWELAFLIYCLDHNIPVERNTESFPYTYDGETHQYYPDFKSHNTYYEVKNYSTPVVQAKCEQFPRDKHLKLLMKNEMKPYLDYVIKVYGKNFAEMYDRDKPSWMDKQK